MIRQAVIEDLKEIMNVIEDAKLQMKERNSSQWDETYPLATDIINDLVINKVFVYDDNGIKGCIVMCEYDELYETTSLWDNVPYVALHRMAVLKESSGLGIASKLLKHCIENSDNKVVRGDTHHTNLGMLKTFEKTGFIHKGVITVNNDENFNTREIFEYNK